MSFTKFSRKPFSCNTFGRLSLKRHLIEDNDIFRQSCNDFGDILLITVVFKGIFLNIYDGIFNEND